LGRGDRDANDPKRIEQADRDVSVVVTHS